MIILLFQWVKIIEFVASNSFLILCDFVLPKTVLRLIQTRTFIEIKSIFFFNSWNFVLVLFRQFR